MFNNTTKNFLDKQTYQHVLTLNDYTVNLSEIQRKFFWLSENLNALKHITPREDDAICNRQPEEYPTSTFCVNPQFIIK